ncbi:MAG TPA: hypothetical protein VKD65_15240, partial [Candidatus Angelobacter sp.]|nr:hypothetical protein [Candidatus Angelobacter sp.]
DNWTDVVTFQLPAHLLLGLSLTEQNHTYGPAGPVEPTPKLTSGTKLSFAALTSAAIQGLCVFAVAINTAKVALGLASVGTASTSSLIHSDPIRFGLRYISAAVATLTLLVLWNGWRLRGRTASRWRTIPLTRRQKWAIGFALASALASWFLIIAEVFAHRRMHPAVPMTPGLEMGQQAPSFALSDQFGRYQSNDTLKGSNETVLLCVRSADS